MKTLRNRLFKALITMLVLIIPITTIKAFWGSPDPEKQELIITLGNWNHEKVDPRYNLNIWEDKIELNQYVPVNQVFTYDNNYYIAIAEYNPLYHGLPSNPSSKWAYVSIDLEWKQGTNYRPYSIVEIDNRFFIANPSYHNTLTNWYTGNPLDSNGNNWDEWLEIMEPSADSFKNILGTNLIDYRLKLEDVELKH